MKRIRSSSGEEEIITKFKDKFDIILERIAEQDFAPAIKDLKNFLKRLNKNHPAFDVFIDLLDSSTRSFVCFGDYDDELICSLIDYFKSLMKFLLEHAPQGFSFPPKILSHLLIPNKKSLFFEIAYEELPSEEDMPYVDFDISGTSILPSLLNHFHEIGGNKQIVEILSAPDIEFSCFVRYVKLFGNIYESYVSNIQKKYIEKVTDVVISSVLDKSAEECRKIEKKSINEIVDILKSMAEKLNDLYYQSLSPLGVSPERKVDNFRLDIAWKWLQLPYLNQRLNGLCDISKICTDVASQFRTEEDEPCSLDENTMIEWLREKRIVEYLFTQVSHREVIKRAYDVVQFLAYKGALEYSQIDLIWNSSLDQHESITHSVWQLLSDLAPYLYIPLLDYLWEKISKVPKSSYDTQYLLLVRDVTCTGIKHQKAKTYGLKFFWNICQDDSELPPIQFSSALEFFLYLITRKEAKVHFCKVLENCIENLRNFKSIPQTLVTMKTIIGKYSISTPIVAWLNEEHDLFSLVFENIKRYSETAMEKAKQLPPNTDLNNFRFAGYYGYRTYCEVLLDTLETFLSKSNLSLDDKQVDKIWEAMIESSLTSEVRDVTFQWLEKALEISSTRDVYILSDSTIEYIFMQKLPNLDYMAYSKEAFDCFEYFFRYMNWTYQRLDQYSNMYWIYSFDILGLDTLWNIALYAYNQEVGDSAIEFLIRLHRGLVIELEEQIGHQRELFLQRCLSSLLPLVENSEKNELPIIRILVMIQKFIASFELTGQNENGKPIELAIQMGNQKMCIEMYDRDSIGDLRYRLALMLRQPLELLRLLGSGKELTDDHIILKSLKLIQPIHVVLRSNVSQNNRYGSSFMIIREKEEKLILPSRILSEDDNFMQFFQLLGMSKKESICLRIWDIIVRLPTPNTMSNTLTTIQPQTDWNSLFDLHNIWKIYYSLLILERIINSTSQTASDKNVVSLWSSQFIQYGGLAHLVMILMNMPFTDTSCGPKRFLTLSLLLRIILYFGYGPTHPYIRDDFSQICGTKMEDIVLRLLELSEYVARSPKIPGENDVESVISSILPFLFKMLSLPPLLEIFLNYQAFDDWLEVLILQSPCSLARETTQKEIADLCNIVTTEGEASPLLQRIMAKMMGMFQAFENLYALENPTVLHQCAEYFSLLNQVFDIIHSRKLISLNASGAQWSFSLTIDLVKIIISMLSKHPIIETTSSSPVDIFLVGLLNTLKNLLSKNPGLKSSLAYGSSILNLVYRKCLFELPEPSTPHHFFPPLCKTPRSRVAAFAVLFELVKDKFGRKNFEYVLEELMQLHKQQILRKDWSYSPPLYEKASCGFVGLQNLGATCYMNSLLQQFYMRPEFRYGILSVEDTAEKKEESLLYQLQTIFTNLQESAKKSYDPTDFCKACIVDGRPIRTNEQMDVDEFFNKLFDKIESLLKDTPQKKMLDHFFGGNLVNQIISKECDHCSERIESFFTLSLEVKNKNHINESLDLFVQGDVLDGENKYFCGDCNKKVTALKRSCISKLPNNLILHLKRFEYDLTTNRRSKVNQYCSFEFQLDLEPFTKEGLDRREKGTQQAEDIHPDYYIYELTGILVHTGTTESGHYYSYIRDPNTKLWYLFNDQSVTPFDISQMPDQCYGGFEYSTVWDPILQKPVPKQYPKHNNAYMLFYDRVYKDNSQLVPSIPEALFQEVWKKNRKFLIDKTLFDSDYSNFMRNMLDMAQQDQSVDEELRIKLIELGTRYFIQPLAHSRDKSKLPDFTRILKFLYSGNELACKWFLQTLINNNWLFDMLFQCDTPEVQFQFVELVNYVVSEMDKIESEKYDEYINELENTATQEKENSETQVDQMTVENDSVLVVPKFLYVLVELRKNVFKYPKYYMYYFYLFEKITLIGGKMRSLLIRMNIPKIFVELFTKIPEKNSALRKNCKYLVGTLSILARGSIIERHPGNPSPLELEECCPVANPETFIDYEFVYNAISDGTNNEAIANILVHLSWNNEQFSTKVVENIAKGFEKDTFSNYGNHFEIFRVLLNINDSLKPTRMKSITRNFVNITNQFLKFKNATASSISFLLDYIKQYQSENVLEVLDEMKAQWFIWILYEEKEVARTCTRDLILSLSPLTPSPITEETLSTIRPRLHEMIHLLLNVLATNRTQYISFAKPTECGSIKEIKQYDFALVQYFSLLQLFILSKEEQDLFKDHITNFVDLLPYTNHSLVPQNCNQLEMVKFFWVLTRKNPELLEVLAKSKNFMDHYLSITMSPQTIEFNSNFLFYYYRLLAKILKIFPEFQEKVFNHTSFYWAIKNIYLSPSYPNLSGKLQSILDLVMNDERRFVIVEKLVPDLKNMDLCLKKSLSLLTTYLNMNSLIAFNFIQNKGLTQLSDRITKLGKTVIQESLLVILKFLELLFLKIADPAQEELRNVLCEYSDQITQITLKLSDLVISPQTLDILKIITNTLLQIVTLTYRNDIQTVHYTQVARLSLNLLIQHFSKVVKPAVESVSIEYIEHRTTFICKLCSLFLFPEEQFDCLEEKTLEEVESKAIHLVVKEGFEAFKTSFSSRAVVISLLFRIWSNDKLQGKLKSETTFVPLIFSLLSTSFFPMDMHTGIGFQFLSSVIPEIMRNMDQDTKSKLLQTITNNFFLLKVTPIEEETLLVQGLIGIFSIISELEEGLQELFKSEVDCTWVKEILEHLKDTTPDKDRLKVLLW